MVKKLQLQQNTVNMLHYLIEWLLMEGYKPTPRS